jgi:hypothetical protein
VSPVEAVLSHELKQYVIDGNNVILAREETDQKGTGSGSRERERERERL